ncbi:MAG TPA: deoxynucleoside kinase [Bacilli bacterium]
MSVIVIDGMTGAGKSTLANILAEELRFDLIAEVFRDDDDLLGKYFSEGSRWCFPMQISFLTNRFIQYREAVAGENVIMDRSIFSDPIFACLYHANGDMKPEEYRVYKRLYQSLINSLTPPDLVIYLDVTAEEAIARIKRRARADELAVSEQYWRNLHALYADHYRNYRHSPLFWLDVNQLDYANDRASRNQVVHEVKARLGMAK